MELASRHPIKNIGKKLAFFESIIGIETVRKGSEKRLGEGRHVPNFEQFK